MNHPYPCAVCQRYFERIQAAEVKNPPQVALLRELWEAHKDQYHRVRRLWHQKEARA